MLSCLNGISEYAPGEGIVVLWDSVGRNGRSKAEFKCRLVKLGTERTFQSTGRAHLGSHTLC